MTTTPILSQEDVLLSFAAEPAHGQATLLDYFRRYPQYSAALAELAVELMIAPGREDAVGPTDDAAVDRAWHAFKLHAAPLETKSLGTAGSLLAALPPGQFRAVATRLGANTLLLAQLRDRVIDVATIPRGFLKKLAGALSATVDALMADLARPPIVAATERFKAEHKPEAGKRISFDMALKNSGLDEAQQAKLRAETE